MSLIGTFFVMSMFGFTLNNLSLFGLVLAIGIVVDDAIVVVENVERNIEAGLQPHDAARQEHGRGRRGADRDRAGAVAVFVPSAFITGISGQFYRQFALTIAGATIISLIVSLTLSPALCALLLKPHGEHGSRRLVDEADPWLLPRVQPRLRRADARLRLAVGACRALRRPDAGGLCRRHRLRPQRIPQDADRLHPAARPRLSDRRHAIAAGASLTRTDDVNRRAVDIALKIPGVAHAVNIVGFSGATFTNAPNAGAIFVVLDPFEERAEDPRQIRRRDPGAVVQQLAGDPGRR